MIIIVFVFFVVVASYVYYRFLRNLVDVMLAVSPVNRMIEPKQIWLLGMGVVNIFIGTFFRLFLRFILDSSLVIIISTYTSYAISVFIIIWTYRVVISLSQSIKLEFTTRNMPVEERPTYRPGIILCICQIGALLNDFIEIYAVGWVAAIMGLVYWIIYWMRTAEYKKIMQGFSRIEYEEDSIFNNL